MTQRMIDIFTPIDIKVIDHIIVGGNAYSSLAEKGLVSENSLGTASYEPIVIEQETVYKQKAFQNNHHAGGENDLEL